MRNEDGLLELPELAALLQSYLLLLMTFSTFAGDWEGSSVCVEDVKDIAILAREAAKNAYKNILSGRSLDMYAGIGFKDFGNWFNHGGYARVMWLEVLDINMVENLFVESLLPQHITDSRVTVARSSNTVEPPKSACVVTLVSRNQQLHKFFISEDVAARVDRLAVELGLAEVAPETLQQMIEKQSKIGKEVDVCLISRNGFYSLFGSRVAGLSTDAHGSLQSLFCSLDRAGSDGKASYSDSIVYMNYLLFQL